MGIKTGIQVDDLSGGDISKDISGLLPSLNSKEGNSTKSAPWKSPQSPPVPEDKRRSKIPARRYPSNDCVIHVDMKLDDDGEEISPGTAYNVHENEWVELLPLMTVQSQLDLQRVAQNSDASSLELISAMLAERIVSWNWTDMEYQALPNPPTTEDILNLHDEEWVYLLGLIGQGSTKRQRKNE